MREGPNRLRGSAYTQYGSVGGWSGKIKGRRHAMALLHVAEAAQPVQIPCGYPFLRVALGKLVRFYALSPGGKLRTEARHDFRVLRGHILLIQRILAVPVQLKVRRPRTVLDVVDQLPAAKATPYDSVSRGPRPAVARGFRFLGNGRLQPSNPRA